MQQALYNLNEEVQQAVWSGTPRYRQWRICHVAVKVGIPELRGLLRVPRVELIHGSPCLLICAEHHGWHTRRADLLFPERSADCNELTALVFKNNNTLRFCRPKLAELLMHPYYASQETCEAPPTVSAGAECAAASYNELLLTSQTSCAALLSSSE